MGFFKWYNGALTTHPLITKMFTSFVTFGTGDFVCQQIEKSRNKEKKYNFLRTLKQASFGFMVTPYLHLQFCKIMPWLFKGKGVGTTVKNVVYDQIIGAPIFTAMFFIYLNMSNNKSFEESVKELEKKLLPTLYMTWKIWPFLMFLNFYFIPVPYRVLFSNITGIFWSAYLSSAQNSN